MANGKGRVRPGNIPSQLEKVGFLQTNRPCGGGDSITFSLQRSSLGRAGKTVFIISSVGRVVPPSQTCLCVEFAPFPCVDLNKGPILNMANPYADIASRIKEFSFCLAHAYSATEVKYS